MCEIYGSTDASQTMVIHNEECIICYNKTEKNARQTTSKGLTSFKAMLKSRVEFSDSHVEIYFKRV